MDFSIKQALTVVIVLCCAVAVVGATVATTDSNNKKTQDNNDKMWGQVDANKGYWGKLLDEYIAFYSASGLDDFHGVGEWVSASSDNPTSNTKEFKVTNSNVTVWGVYSFFHTQTILPNDSNTKAYSHSFVAKFPKGIEATPTSNGKKDITWLTSNMGTGEWQRYTYITKNTTKDIGYIALSPTQDYKEKGCTAYVAESKVFEISDEYSSEFNEHIKNTKHVFN